MSDSDVGDDALHSGPSLKRIKLGSESPTPSNDANKQSRQSLKTATALEDNCAICLQAIVDRTVLPVCSHEFCYECILVWSEQSRRCPLCSQSLGNHLIHNIRSKYDYQKYYLPPLVRSPPHSNATSTRTRARPRPRPRTEREWGRRLQEREETDRFDRAVAKRRWVYQHHLYAKHVASNSHTRYRPCPTPSQFAASPDLIQRVTMFLRRELRVWINMDVEFLTTFIVSLMKTIDIQSESAIKLLAEFLDMDTEYVDGRRHPNAEHFAHELCCYLRSPCRDLFVYDTVVQYDTPSNFPPEPENQPEHSTRWRASRRSPSPEIQPPPVELKESTPYTRRSRSRSRSTSWSPSGRHFVRTSDGWEVEAGETSEHDRGEGPSRPETKGTCRGGTPKRPADDHPKDRERRSRLEPVSDRHREMGAVVTGIGRTCRSTRDEGLTDVSNSRRRSRSRSSERGRVRGKLIDGRDTRQGSHYTIERSKTLTWNGVEGREAYCAEKERRDFRQTDVKGKRKANDGDTGDDLRNITQIDGEMSTNAAYEECSSRELYRDEASITATASRGNADHSSKCRERNTKVPRSRDLLESVHMHLSLSTRSRRGTLKRHCSETPTSHRSHSPPPYLPVPPSVSSAADVPSSFAPMSEPNSCGNDQVKPRLTCKGQSPPPLPPPSSFPFALPHVHATNNNTLPSSSTRSITNQERFQSPSRSNRDSTSQDSIQDTADKSPATSKPGTGHSSGDLCMERQSRSQSKSSPEPTDRRKRLMDRLSVEKRHLLSQPNRQLSTSHGQEQEELGSCPVLEDGRGSDTISSAPNTGTDGVERSSLLDRANQERELYTRSREAKLRLRAQLRARLTAVKSEVRLMD